MKLVGPRTLVSHFTSKEQIKAFDVKHVNCRDKRVEGGWGCERLVNGGFGSEDQLWSIQSRQHPMWHHTHCRPALLTMFSSCETWSVSAMFHCSYTEWSKYVPCNYIHDTNNHYCVLHARCKSYSPLVSKAMIDLHEQKDEAINAYNENAEWFAKRI